MTAPAAEVPAPSPARPLQVAAGLLVATTVLYVRDPHVAGSYGFCPWHALTGGYCPGCGALRAVHDLAHGDLVAAASSNLLLVAAVPVALVLWAVWLRAAWWHRRARSLRAWTGARTRVVLWSLAAVVVAFTVLRNLEPGAWLAP
jgi:Protein of unknown function (DUF2752)